MSTVNAPDGRRFHTAVWTGNSMIVWGGNNGTQVNTGGIYNFNNYAWEQATTTAGAPSIREYATAVWTGNRMIVWGGNAGGRLNTGAKYNPNNDTWTVIATAGAPEPRQYQTALWNGSKMIIWGGLDGGTLYNTGGLYDFAGDSWSAIVTTGAPAPRYFQTGVYTGDNKFLIFGGGDGVTVINSGGNYDIGGGTWSTATPVNAPPTRFEHTAAWTGTRMLVFGGWDNNTIYQNTGGVYDPGYTDSTAPTVVAVTSDAKDNTYESGHVLNILVNFSESVTVTGTPKLTLETGGTDRLANYYTGSTTPTLLFRYTVQYGDTSADLEYVSTDSLQLNGGTIKDAATNNATLTLPALGSANSLGGDKAIVIDAVGVWTNTSTTGAPDTGASSFFVANPLNNKIYIWGGNNGSYINTGGIYDVASNSRHRCRRPMRQLHARVFGQHGQAARRSSLPARTALISTAAVFTMRLVIAGQTCRAQTLRQRALGILNGQALR
jgi:hypothetical protein